MEAGDLHCNLELARIVVRVCVVDDKSACLGIRVVFMSEVAEYIHSRERGYERIQHS